MLFPGFSCTGGYSQVYYTGMTAHLPRYGIIILWRAVVDYSGVRAQSVLLT